MHMSSEIKGIYNTLKKTKYKEKKSINYNKILTISVFFIFLIGGSIFFLNKNTAITGQVVHSANLCSFYNNIRPMPVGSFYCTHEYDGEKIELNLKHVNPLEQKPIKVTGIKVNSCGIETNIILKTNQESSFIIPCKDLTLKNKLKIEYLNLESGIEFSIEGQIINIA